MSAFVSFLILPLLTVIGLLFPEAPQAPQPAEPQLVAQGEEASPEETPSYNGPFYDTFIHGWERSVWPQVDFDRLQREYEAAEKQDIGEWFELLGDQLIENDFKIVFWNYPRIALVFDVETGEFRGVDDEGAFHSGFSYNAYKSLFYATKNPWMRVMGFSEFYDWLGDDFLGMFQLITRRVRFEYDGLDYQIQIWKGKYFFDTCMGAEVGIYTKPQSRRIDHYDCYPLEKMMPMTLKLYNERNVYFDLPAEDHWWAVMMAHRQPRIDPHRVTLENSIDFSDDPGLGEAYYAALAEQCPDFEVTKEGDVVWFRWNATAPAVDPEPEPLPEPAPAEEPLPVPAEG